MPLDNRRLPLLHLQREALGADTTARLISPLLHIAPRVSLCLSARRLSSMFRCEVFYLSNPRDTSLAFLHLAGGASAFAASRIIKVEFRHK